MQEQQLFSPDSATVAAWVADPDALADQVDSLSDPAKTELGPEAEPSRAAQPALPHLPVRIGNAPRGRPAPQPVPRVVTGDEKLQISHGRSSCARRRHPHVEAGKEPAIAKAEPAFVNPTLVECGRLFLVVAGCVEHLLMRRASV